MHVCVTKGVCVSVYVLKLQVVEGVFMLNLE